MHDFEDYVSQDTDMELYTCTTTKRLQALQEHLREGLMCEHAHHMKRLHERQAHQGARIVREMMTCLSAVYRGPSLPPICRQISAYLLVS